MLHVYAFAPASHLNINLRQTFVTQRASMAIKHGLHYTKTITNTRDVMHFVFYHPFCYKRHPKPISTLVSFRSLVQCLSLFLPLFFTYSLCLSLCRDWAHLWGRYKVPSIWRAKFVPYSISRVSERERERTGEKHAGIWIAGQLFRMKTRKIS